MTDRELLDLYVSRRDESAFRNLVDRHIHMVYSAARRELGGPGAEAEDVAQAVFLLLAQKAAKIPPRRPLAAWLYQATRYCCANLRKTEGRRRRHEREVAMPAYSASTDTPSETATLLPLLNEGLSHLGEKERAALLVRYLEDRTIADAAQSLHISTKAAEKRLERGLHKLRAFFARHGYSVGLASVTGLLTIESAKAAPATLASAATSAALHAGSAAAISLTTLTIAKGAANMMFWIKVKFALLACLAAALLATGAGTAVHLALAQAVEPAPAITPAAPAGGAAQPAPLLATLPSGARIEILAITSMVPVGAPNVWWKPDGTPLPDFQYEYKAYKIVGDPPLAVAYRITPPGADLAVPATARISSPEGNVSHTGLGRPAATPGAAPGPVADPSAVDLHPSARPFTLRFELATGTWTTRCTTAVAPSMATSRREAKDLIAISCRAEADGRITVDCVDSFTREAARLVSVSDKLTAQAVSYGVDAPFRQMNLTSIATDAKSVEFQTRPYTEFAEFSNFSPAPGLRTSPDVHSGTFTPIAAPAIAPPAPASNLYYVGGDVTRPGVYSMANVRVTAKQAMIAAGYDLAQPATLTIVRRAAAGNTEDHFTLDLPAIFAGTKPDLYLQSDDLLLVQRIAPQTRPNP